VEVVFGVDADRVMGGRFDVDGDVVLEETELLEALCSLQRAGGKGGKAVEGSFAVGVEAKVLPVAGASGVSIIGDGGAGEVKCSAIECGDDFYGVRVGDIRGSTGNLEGGYVDSGVAEGAEKAGKVLGAEQGLVALDVDVNIRRMELGDGMDAVRTAR
jgi:hypothetical protein